MPHKSNLCTPLRPRASIGPRSSSMPRASVALQVLSSRERWPEQFNQSLPLDTRTMVARGIAWTSAAVQKKHKKPSKVRQQKSRMTTYNCDKQKKEDELNELRRLEAEAAARATEQRNRALRLEAVAAQRAPPNISTAHFWHFKHSVHYRVTNLDATSKRPLGIQKPSHTFWCSVGRYATEYRPMWYKEASNEQFQEYAALQQKLKPSPGAAVCTLRVYPLLHKVARCDHGSFLVKHVAAAQFETIQLNLPQPNSFHAYPRRCMINRG